MTTYAPTRTVDVGIRALDELLSRLEPERHDAGDVLIRQGDVSEFALFLAEGTVAVFAESDYGRTQLASLEAPRLIGELGVLAAFPRTATIEATTPLSVYRLSRSQLIDVGEAAPDFLLSVIGQLGRQLDGMNRAMSLYGDALSALERREFDARILEDLAHPSPQLVTFGTAFRRFAEQIIDKRRQSDELASAALIQRSFLPDRDALKSIDAALDLKADMRPASDVGGDFYDYFPIDESRVAIAIGDVCGKGIPASLFMAVAITTLRSAAAEEQDVAAILAKANANLCRRNDASMFATLFFAVVDVRSGELEYGNCGHNPPYIISGGERQKLPATGIPIGLMPDRPARSAMARLGSGDTLVLFTDGVTEAMNPAREEFGTARLEAMLDEIADASPAALLSEMFRQVDAFADGAQQSDDITGLTLRLR